MIQIATPAPEDAEGIQTLLYTTWLDTYPNEEAGITARDIEQQFDKAFSDDVLENLRASFRTPPPQEVSVIAKDGDTVVGLCRVKMQGDTNRLQTLYVLPSHQKRGIGTRMWQRVRTSIDTQKEMVVRMVCYNKKALAFYQTLGFTKTRDLPPEECFHMKSGKVLPEMELHLRTPLQK